MALEIERKYLIRMPNLETIAEFPGTEIWEIVQTYLMDGENGESRRLRRIRQNDAETYIYTRKRHITSIKREEIECEISRSEYEKLLKQSATKGTPIHKVRYRVPYHAQILEIDVYSFWKDRATLEVELQSEDQRVYLPEWVQIIRDVSDEKRYTNKQLSIFVPMEDIGSQIRESETKGC